MVQNNPIHAQGKDEENNLANRIMFAKYKISDIDDAADPKYYGFITADGHWYILEENTAAKTYRYAAGTSEYTTAWTGRAGLTYYYYYEVY